MILEQAELKELSELQRLIEAGLERGSLNTGEIVEVLAELEIEVDQIEELYRELEAQGIEIIETPAVVEEKVARHRSASSSRARRTRCSCSSRRSAATRC